MLPKRMVGFPSSLHCARIDGSTRRDRVHGQALNQMRRHSAKPTFGARGNSGCRLQCIAIPSHRPDRITYLFTGSKRDHAAWTMRGSRDGYSVTTCFYAPNCATIVQRSRLPIWFACGASRTETAKQICVGNKKSWQVRRNYSHTFADTRARW